MSKVIFVVGLHRSGSSCVAGVLHHLGVPMGEPDPDVDHKELYDGKWPISPSNPKGQFEDNRFVRIFSENIGNWRSPQTHLVSGEVIDKTQALINKLSSEHEVWGLKTPQLGITLKWILALRIADLQIIVIKRPFDNCVESMMKRDNTPRPVAEHSQSIYYCCLLEGLAVAESAKVPILEVEYEDLLRETGEEVRKIERFVFPEFEFGSIWASCFAADFVDPSLNHSQPRGRVGCL